MAEYADESILYASHQNMEYRGAFEQNRNMFRKTNGLCTGLCDSGAIDFSSTRSLLNKTAS